MMMSLPMIEQILLLATLTMLRINTSVDFESGYFSVHPPYLSH
jgi:hypothetical protein